MDKHAIVIGVDLGTTNSVAAVWNATGAVTIKDHSSLFTPSVVAFTDKGERLVGEVARRQQHLNARNTVHSIKQIIGRQFADPVVAETISHWPFRVQRGPDGTCRICVKIGPKHTLVRPEAISAAVLARLVANAERKLAAKVQGAVITVPASFSIAQRTATENAAAIAGIKVMKLMNEPTAAAYVYGASLLDAAPQPRHMLVFDFGGGTLDVAVLYVPASTTTVTEDDMHIKAVDADLTLGGDTFTVRLANYCLEQLPIVSGLPAALFRKAAALSAIYLECEDVKKALSDCRSSTCNLVLAGDKTAQLEISRETFDALCEEDFQRIKSPVERVLKQAGIQRQQIDRVLLVGGTTRIPAIRAMLLDFFDGKVELNHQVDPDEAVAHGAAIEAARIAGMLHMGNSEERRNLMLMRSKSHDPWMDREHQEHLGDLRSHIGRDSHRRPARQAKSFATMPSPSRSMANLPKMRPSFDVLPHALSIVYGKGACWQMLPANCPYPVSAMQRFPKQWADQDSITISIVEGESQQAVDNELVGRFEVSGLRDMPSGIDVTFAINDSGLLEVTALAVDDPTNQKKITVTSVTPQLSPEDLEQLRQKEAIKQEVSKLLQAGEELLKNAHASPQTQAHVCKVMGKVRDIAGLEHPPTAEELKDVWYWLENVPIHPLHSLGQ